MDNPFDEMKRALTVARITQRAVQQHTNEMAQLLRGNLRHADSWNLKALKKELRAFNIHTGRWRDE